MAALFCLSSVIKNGRLVVDRMMGGISPTSSRFFRFFRFL
jgi:hypothetical protein